MITNFKETTNEPMETGFAFTPATEENARRKFLEYAALIKREGFSDLLEWLKGQDFFSAPASTKYHSAVEGGLCFHTVKVFERLVRQLPEIRRFYPSISDEDLLEKVAVVSLLHDLCKTNFYSLSTRNVKNEATQKWEKVPYYTIVPEQRLGHGSGSIISIMKFMKLHDDEMAAIYSHMGDFEDHDTGENYQKYPIALALHIADLEASYWDEKRPEKKN